MAVVVGFVVAVAVAEAVAVAVVVAVTVTEAVTVAVCFIGFVATNRTYREFKWSPVFRILKDIKCSFTMQWCVAIVECRCRWINANIRKLSRSKRFPVCSMINRPGVAGAILQTSFYKHLCYSLTHLLIKPSFVKISSPSLPNRNI